MDKTLFELLQENGSFEITKETTIGDLNSAVVKTRKDKREAFFNDGYRDHIHDFMHVLISPVIGKAASLDENDELKVYVIDHIMSFGFIEGGG